MNNVLHTGQERRLKEEIIILICLFSSASCLLRFTPSALKDSFCWTQMHFLLLFLFLFLANKSNDTQTPHRRQITDWLQPLICTALNIVPDEFRRTCLWTPLRDPPARQYSSIKGTDASRTRWGELVGKKRKNKQTILWKWEMIQTPWTLWTKVGLYHPAYSYCHLRACQESLISD